jgi:hypothetical protein
MPSDSLPRKLPAKQNGNAIKLPTPVLKGTYSIVDSVVTWQGLWGMSAEAFQQEGQTSSFNYRKKDDETLPKQSLPIRLETYIL